MSTNSLRGRRGNPAPPPLSSPVSVRQPGGFREGLAWGGACDNSVVSELTKWKCIPDAMAITEIFQALGDPTRREILRMLRARDMSAGELADKFTLAKSTLSGHF